MSEHVTHHKSKHPIHDSRLGRLRCRVGWHKWAFIQSEARVEGSDHLYQQVIVAYCERPACLEPLTVVNSELFSCGDRLPV